MNPADVKKWLLLALVAIVLISGGVGVWWFAIRKPATAVGTTPNTGTDGSGLGETLASGDPGTTNPDPGGGGGDGGPLPVGTDSIGAPVGYRDAYIVLGYQTRPDLLNISLRIENGYLRIYNTAAGSGLMNRFAIDKQAWLTSIDGTALAPEWPHTVEAWQVNNTDQPSTQWRGGNVPTAQSTFVIRLNNGTGTV